MLTLITITDKSMIVLGCSTGLLLMGGLFVLVRSFFARAGRTEKLLSFFCSLYCFLLLYMISDYLERQRKDAWDNIPRLLSFYGNIPVQSLILLLSAVFAAELYVALRLFFMKRRLLGGEAVKESLDMLPDAVCFADAGGRMILSNIQMSNICHELFGTTIVDLESFWRKAEEQSLGGTERENEEAVPAARDTPETAAQMSGGTEEDISGKAPVFLKTADGHVWDVRRKPLDVRGEPFTELICNDVTEAYTLHEELSARYRILADINKRLWDYSGNVKRVIREQEILSAKIQVHDDVGQCLLAFRSYLQKPEKERKKEPVLELWRRCIQIFQTGMEEKPATDEWILLQNAAAAVSVKIFLEGALPEDETLRSLVIDIVHECVNNTVRHADGHEVRAAAEEADAIFRITVRNDGKPPEGEIRETGGLANIRKRVSLAGGRMEVKGSPEFTLTVEIPCRKNKAGNAYDMQKQGKYLI